MAFSGVVKQYDFFPLKGGGKLPSPGQLRSVTHLPLPRSIFSMIDYCKESLSKPRMIRWSRGVISIRLKICPSTTTPHPKTPLMTNTEITWVIESFK